MFWSQIELFLDYPLSAAIILKFYGIKSIYFCTDTCENSCSYLEFLRYLEEKVENDWPEIASSLEDIRRSLFSKSGCLINLTSDGKNLTNAERHISKFLDLLPSSALTGSSSCTARLPSTNEALVIPTQVELLCDFPVFCHFRLYLLNYATDIFLHI